MTEVPSPQMRISDQNRESALAALNEHVGVGRIDLDEFGERSAQVTAAKTRGDLAAVFADLPAPHPTFDENWQTVAQPEPPPSTVVERPAGREGWSPAQRMLAAFLPLIWIGCIILSISTGSWYVMLVPLGATAVGKGLWGHDWNGNDDRHRLQRDRHRELRDRNRERRRELGR